MKEFEYPDNLMLDMGVIPSLDEDRCKEQIKGLELAIEHLSPGEKRIIGLRYCDGMSIRAAGTALNISPQRVHMVEAKALRKLKHPAYVRMTAYGIENAKTYENMMKQKEALQVEIGRLERVRELLKQENTELGASDRDLEKGVVSIKDMNFSVRTFNILSRNDIKDLWDLSRTTKEQLKEMKNMGKASLIEIMEKAREYDIELDDR